MRTLTIILAQGVQSRIPRLSIPKQLLPLPACAETPILYRTLRQIDALPGGDAASRVEIVTWLPVAERILSVPQLFNSKHYVLSVDTLMTPGNSSLKGLHAYLVKWEKATQPYERIVVLLGDVVYSCDALAALYSAPRSTLASTLVTPIHFVGTSTLSPSTGELWGLAWSQSSVIREVLHLAMSKHPPFEEYQPGQLRRLLWAAREHKIATLYTPIDDYTRDIDLPEHLAMIPDLSEHARIDDAAHGMTW